MSDSNSAFDESAVTAASDTGLPRSGRIKKLWPWLAIPIVLGLTALQLNHQGRLWGCGCGWYWLWTGNAWSAQTSQSFLDPYSFTHLLHGMVLCGLAAILAKRIPVSWRFALAIVVESCWEIIENSEFVIQRYRVATAALGYHGDSVVNSMGDILCCALGFALASKLGWRRSIALFLVTELVLLIWIRDSLLLELIMLVFPVHAIKVWQLG